MIALITDEFDLLDLPVFLEVLLQFPGFTLGDFGLQATERGWITARQIEPARVAMTRKFRRGGKVWINLFPDKPVTEKPAETRMGSGKGNPEFWVAVVKPGRTLFELSYPNEQLAKEALNKAIQKLPIKARVVTREELRHRLWPDGTVVDFDNNLNSAVTSLRSAFRDSARRPRVIETIPRVGYRLVANLEETGLSDEQDVTNGGFAFSSGLAATGTCLELLVQQAPQILGDRRI